jgi:hypothetical protein
MKEAAAGCGGDRTTIKYSSLAPKGGFSVEWLCPRGREWYLEKGEGLHMKYDPCANANASDVQAQRNGCSKWTVSDGSAREVPGDDQKGIDCNVPAYRNTKECEVWGDELSRASEAGVSGGKLDQALCKAVK